MSGDGGQAFPTPAVRLNEDHFDYGTQGMTLRDYFAAKAMAALIGKLELPLTTYDQNLSVTQAYEYADAMLAERAKGPK